MKIKIDDIEGVEFELQRRQRARENFADYVKFVMPEFIFSKCHYEICDALTKVAFGKLRHLMIMAPPRHGKSVLVSVLFVAWYFGLFSKREIIAASRTVDLSEKFSVGAKDIIEGAAHQLLFGTKIDPDSRAKDDWRTTNKNSYMAAGIGTAITGFGAHLLLIDDPFGEDNISTSNGREKVYEWYGKVANTRLSPEGAVILINARWADDDLSGRLLDASNCHIWLVLKYQAIDEEGNVLCPERWTKDRVLNEIKPTMSDDAWNSLYQQDPVPAKGLFFKPSLFRNYIFAPANLSIIAACDYATSQGTGDYTEFGIAGVNRAGEIYILDWWRGRVSSDIWIDKQCDLIEKYNPMIWFGEKGAIQKLTEPFLIKRMIERKVYCCLDWLPSTADKETRCLTIQAMLNMGKVFLPIRADWKSDLTAQLYRFPKAKHDDAVDVFSLLGRGIAKNEFSYISDVTESKGFSVHVDNRWRAFV